ncbi:MAG TPA: hypothetical protein DEB46_08200 [Myxococcales bacterium]|nr:hypothetical protein [Myxococcales bacterium]
MSLLLSLLIASPTPSPTPLNIGGRWLFKRAQHSEIPLGMNKDGERPLSERGDVGSNHFRARLQGHLIPSLSIDAAVDLYEWSQPSSGDRTQNQLSPLDLRVLQIKWTTSFGRLTLGRGENRWGLGIVAGGRQARSNWTYPFDQPAQSDNVLMAGYGLKLGHFQLGISAQQVLQDENASTPILKALTRDLDATDEAYQAVVALRWVPQKDRTIGIYGAYRQQRDANASQMNAFLLDTAIDWEGNLGLADRWRIALELALLTGRTNRMISEAGLLKTQDEGDDLSATALGIQSFGIAGIGGLKLQGSRLHLEFEGGYASGDANSEDHQLNRFSFDQQYQVGLVLVPWFWRSLTEETWRRSSDPNLSGEPPRGIEHYRSRGALSGLAYLNPRVSWMSGRKKGLGVHLGLLVVTLPEGSSDPFWSFRRGAATNPFGGSANDYLLGSEIDIGVSLTSTHRKGRYASRVGLELGVASPGPAMADESGQTPETMWLGRFSLDLRAKELLQ